MRAEFGELELYGRKYIVCRDANLRTEKNDRIVGPSPLNRRAIRTVIEIPSILLDILMPDP